MNARKVIAILGPTGTGKSELALSIAQQFDGEVVNCDSLQIYRYFDIGTAKLPPAERRGIPHHLIDILDPDQIFTAGEYARLARRCSRRRVGARTLTGNCRGDRFLFPGLSGWPVSRSFP